MAVGIGIIIFGVNLAFDMSQEPMMALIAGGGFVVFGGGLLIGGLGFELYLRSQGDRSNARVNEVVEDVVMSQVPSFLLLLGAVVDRTLSRISRR